jgi:ABC-type sugar transport system ATPase subunit
MASTAPPALPFLQVRGLSKRFGAIQALDSVSLEVRSGEVHGLVGANGAGKSTLIRALAGVQPPDSGTIVIDGNEVSLPSPAKSTALGLNFIHQELNLVPKLTALQNLTLGLPKLKRAGVFINWSEVERQVAWVAERLNMRFSLRALAQDLSVGDRWLIAIGKALLRRARLICMDEPTASLSDDETQRLFTLIRDLASSGVAILYVTHRLQEILDLCSSVTVFRDGRVVSSLTRAEMTREILIHEIIGGALGTVTAGPSSREPAGAPVLELRRLSRPPAVRDVSFSLYAGEVLGLAGLVGAGRTEVARLIFGADRPDSGEIWLQGQRLGRLTPRRAVDKGIALVPEERRSQGLVLSETVMLNVNMSSLEALRLVPRAPVISKARGRERAAGQVRSLGIKCQSVNDSVRQLSGGNQQKVVVSKWLVRDARVLILDEPTRGVDVNARAGIYEIIRRLAAEGRAVVVISSEFEEFALCCDRVLVMVEGGVVGELVGPEITEPRILELSYAPAPTP